MDIALNVILYLYLPVLLVCAAFYGAGRAVTHETLGRVLRKSAVVWLILLWTAFSMISFAENTCEGGVLPGYWSCTTMPLALANLASVGNTWLILLAPVYWTGLALIGAVLEWRHRRAAKT